MADLSQLLLLAQLAALGGGGQGLAGILGGGGGIPSPDALKWQQIQANAALPAQQNPATMTQAQAFPPGGTAPAQFQDPKIESPDKFVQEYADKQNRNALIEGALGGLAGLLTPQYGPMGRRTWGGQIGSALSGGLAGYNAAEQAQGLEDYRQGQLGVGQARAAATMAGNQTRATQGNERNAIARERLQIAKAGKFTVFTDDQNNVWERKTQDPDPANWKPVINTNTGQQMKGHEAAAFTFTPSDAGLIVGNRKTGATRAPIPGTGRTDVTPVPTDAGIIPFKTKGPGAGTVAAPVTGPGGVPLRKPTDLAAEELKIQTAYKNEHPWKTRFGIGELPTVIGPTNQPDGVYTNGKEQRRVINGIAYKYPPDKYPPD